MRGGFRILVLCAVGSAVALLTGCPRQPATPEAPPTVTPEPVIPGPTPAPPPYVPNRKLEVGKIFNGLNLKTEVETVEGTTASADRANPEAYSVELKVRVNVPKPHQNLGALLKLNPTLSEVLPGLGELLKTAAVSPVFDDLYRLKVSAIQSNILRLDAMPSRHNFYDCETILNLQDPATKRRAVLLQADMDTDTDGSDADRMPEIDGSSVTFQPFTSYKWPKKGKQVNSFIVPRQARLKQLQQEAAMGGQSAARQAEVKATTARLKEEVSDLGKYSYLLGSADPYVVLPGTMFAARNRSPFAPSVGDFCVVIFGDTLYPAVVGDVGPMNVLGEASLRICREINDRADANNRAANDLKVTYLFFPGSAEKPFDVPNLDKWRERCDSLLKELGGYSGKLFAWEDLTKPKPVPEGSPAVTSGPPETPATEPKGAQPVVAETLSTPAVGNKAQPPGK